MEVPSDTVNTGLGTIANDTYSYINNLLLNPSVIIILVIIVVIYLVLFMSLGPNNLATSGEQVSNSSSATLTIIVVSFFIILVVINGLQYFFGVDIVAKLTNLFTGNPEVDITVDTSSSRAEAIKAPVPEILIRPQVFNIPGNNYIYSDLKSFMYSLWF